MADFFEKVKNFLGANWEDIVKFFEALWKFAKSTVLKDDSIFADDDATDASAEG